MVEVIKQTKLDNKYNNIDQNLIPNLGNIQDPQADHYDYYDNILINKNEKPTADFLEKKMDKNSLNNQKKLISFYKDEIDDKLSNKERATLQYAYFYKIDDTLKNKLKDTKSIERTKLDNLILNYIKKDNIPNKNRIGMIKIYQKILSKCDITIPENENIKKAKKGKNEISNEFAYIETYKKNLSNKEILSNSTNT